ncbi:MAG: hypothetical protein LUH18_04150 [Oscillospiraceae bacterium]|nr:hypothetical protein [Oscillospiraceae bacterium]
MPRPLLKPLQNQSQPETKSGGILSAKEWQEQKKQSNTKMDKMVLDRLLRKKRSQKYMDAIHKLDAGGHVHNQNIVDGIIDDIREEFPEVSIEGIMLGIVSKCYIGPEYEVHALGITGEILEHYKIGQKMPGGLERARSLAMRGGYDFIEVYVDCLRCVSSNGTVSVVNM